MSDGDARFGTLLANLREQHDAGASVALRLRLRRIEALAARMATSHGSTRAVLERRLHQLLTAAEPAASRAHDRDRDAAEAPAARGRAALSALLDELRARHSPPSPDPGPEEASADVSGPVPDVTASGAFAPLPALQAARQTWARLRMDEHLRHVMAEVPDDAGPMHSTVLVHRAITLMHEAAPAYLPHFLGYIDALAALERISPAPVSAASPRSSRPPRQASTRNAPPPRKSARSRPRSRRRPG